MNPDSKDQEFKEFIQAHQRSFIVDNLPKAHEVYETALENPFVPFSDKLKAARDVELAAGVLPTKELSIYIQNIYNQNNLTLNPQVLQVIQEHNDKLEWKNEDKEIDE